MVILTMFMVLLLLLSINVPIAIGLAVTTIIAMVMKTGTSFLIDTAIVMFDGSMKFPLIAIPLFILAGSIMNSAGISRRLIAFASALVGFIKGGLSMINIATSMFFAEISGSAVADVAALGSILIPAMKKKGYPGAFAAAVTSSSASLAIIIPPSIPMIVYAVMSQSSVVQLFVAGIIPGVIGGFFLMLAAYVTARKKNFPVEETFNIPNVKKTAKDAALAFLLPVIILGGIFGGVVTATEGAGLAVVASLVIGFIYKEIDFKRLYESACEGAIQTASVMLLVAASVLLGEFLTIEQIPQKVAESIIEFTNNKYDSFPEYVDQQLDQIEDEDVAFLVYTSGTTGKPKGSISQYRLLNRTPSVKLAKLFIKLSDGRLNWDSIFGPASEVNSSVAEPKDRSQTKSRPLEKRKGVPVRN